MPLPLRSQGEYVAVEKVEGELKKFEMLEQLWVYGNSFENCLVAVVVPVEAKMMAWAKSHHIKGDFKEVCATPQVSPWCPHVPCSTDVRKQLAVVDFS